MEISGDRLTAPQIADALSTAARRPVPHTQITLEVLWAHNGRDREGVHLGLVMIRSGNTFRIARTPAVVFGHLADVERLPRWNYAIAAARRLGDGLVTVGARYAQIRTVRTRSEEVFVVIVFEPNRRLAIRGGFGPFSGDVSCALEAGGDLRHMLGRAVC